MAVGAAVALPAGGIVRAPGARPGFRDAELAHDARNLMSALNLCCELLARPGVLTPEFRHYAEDLRRVGQTGARLLEALAAVTPDSSQHTELAIDRHPFPGICDLAAELLALEDTLRALAGPDIDLEVECAECAGSLALNAEDLLRILFNLVANTVEAMRRQPNPGNRRRYLRITAQRGSGASFLSPWHGRPDTVILAVRDNGPGIAREDLPYIFEPGFSTRGGRRGLDAGLLRRGEVTRDGDSHGLGLAIVRQLVEAAGGIVRAVSSPGIGARFDIELPLTPGGGLSHEIASEIASELDVRSAVRRIIPGIGPKDEITGAKKILKRR